MTTFLLGIFSLMLCLLDVSIPEKSESSLTSQDLLQTSVLRSSMEQRISRLGQFINEAQWRFQLVSWNNGTNSQKNRNTRRRLSRRLQRIADSDELSWKAQAAQDENSDDTLVEGSTGKKDLNDRL